MDLTEEEVQEFKNEAAELLDQAERELLALEKGGDYASTYSAVFRVFHSIKGGAGMLGMDALQSHMHQLESQYQECKSLETLPAPLASYFLDGIDVSRQIMDGESPPFDFGAFDRAFPNSKAPSSFTGHASSKAQAASPPAPASSTPPSTPPQKMELPLEGVAPFSAEGTRILVIDDEPDLLDILKDILQLSGFEVETHTSGVEALNRVKSFKPDAVLTDYRMPEMTGMDVLRKVNSIDPDLPVLFLSGNLSKEVVLDALSAGVFGVLEKPFKQEDVVGLCKNAAERYQVTKLLNRTISFIFYQYSDLDQYLVSKGAAEIRNQVHSQFQALLEAKRKLTFLNRSRTSR
jgi:CheY-like chemotaxis protein/HPt (histidine-containing phosphotransfer) domain-containing protein